MKKLLGILVAIVMLSSVAMADSYGIKGALNMASAGGADADGTSSVMKFSVGGVMIKKLADQWDLQAELNYAMKGAMVDATDKSIDLSYIEVPVLAKYNLSNNMYVLGGGYLAYLLGADYDGTDLKDLTSSLDYGIIIGGGMNVAQNVLVDLRYSMGLATTDESGDTNITNVAYGVSVAYLF